MKTHINATFWHRLLANLIDFSLGFIITSFFLLYVVSSISLAEAFYRSLLTLAFFLSPFGLFYSIGLVYYFQATPGKMLTGLKILSTDDKPLSFKLLFFRQTVGHLFSSLLFGLGYLAIFKDTQRRSWHDKASLSKVIISQNIWFVGLVSLIIFSGASGYLVYQSIQRAISGPLKNEIQTLIQSYREEQKNRWQKQANEEATPSTTATSQIYNELSDSFIKTQDKIYDYYDQKDYKNALDTSQQLLKDSHTSIEKAVAYRMLAQIQLAQGLKSDSQKSALEAIKLTQQDAPSYDILTRIELENRNYPKAIEYAKKTVELAPEIAVFHNQLGVALFDSGNNKEAGIAEIKKAIELDPTNQLFKDNLKQMQEN